MLEPTSPAPLIGVTRRLDAKSIAEDRA